eukprot:2762524-Rhodomonas_salina.1
MVLPEAERGDAKAGVLRRAAEWYYVTLLQNNGAVVCYCMLLCYIPTRLGCYGVLLNGATICCHGPMLPRHATLSATVWRYDHMVLRACYAVCGTDRANAATS